MIDKRIFMTWIAILGDRYGRDMKPPTIRALYEDIKGELSDDEFVLGCRICLRREEFFPSLQKIADAARPPASPELLGADAFDRVRAGWYYYDDAFVKEVVRLAGGREYVMTNNIRDLPHARHEFIKVYTMLLRHDRDVDERERLFALPVMLSHKAADVKLLKGDTPIETEHVLDIDPEGVHA